MTMILRDCVGCHDVEAACAGCSTIHPAEYATVINETDTDVSSGWRGWPGAKGLEDLSLPWLTQMSNSYRTTQSVTDRRRHP